MADRIAEQGAMQYAIANPNASVSRLGGAGYLQGAIQDAITNGKSNSSASRLGAQGRIYAKAGESNLITNGTFDTDTAWIKVSATIGSGVATIDASGSILQDIIPLETGILFNITLDVVSVAGAVIVYCGTTSSGDARYATQFTTTGSKSFQLQSAGTNDDFRIAANATTGGASVDNVTVRRA